RVAGSFEEPQNYASEANFVAIVHRHVIDWRIGGRAQINFRTRLGCQLNVAAHKISVQVRLDDVLDFEPLRPRLIYINGYVALRVDYACHTLRAQHIRSVRQTSQIKLLKIHLRPQSRMAGIRATFRRTTAQSWWPISWQRLRRDSQLEPPPAPAPCRCDSDAWRPRLPRTSLCTRWRWRG